MFCVFRQERGNLWCETSKEFAWASNTIKETILERRSTSDILLRSFLSSLLYLSRLSSIQKTSTLKKINCCQQLWYELIAEWYICSSQCRAIVHDLVITKALHLERHIVQWFTICNTKRDCIINKQGNAAALHCRSCHGWARGGWAASWLTSPQPHTTLLCTPSLYTLESELDA